MGLMTACVPVRWYKVKDWILLNNGKWSVTLDCKQIPGYKRLKKDNFVIRIMAIESQSGSVYKYVTLNHSYDASTGTLTIMLMESDLRMNLYFGVDAIIGTDRENL